MKKTIVKISPIIFKDFLHLSENINIENIAMDRFKNEIQIILEGDSLPDFAEIKSGNLISHSEIIYTKTITNEFKKINN